MRRLTLEISGLLTFASFGHRNPTALRKSMLSLFMSITGGVSWEQLLLPLHAVSPIWVWVFLFYARCLEILSCFGQ